MPKQIKTNSHFRLRPRIVKELEWLFENMDFNTKTEVVEESIHLVYLAAQEGRITIIKEKINATDE